MKTHHIWCNNVNPHATDQDATGCWMCESLERDHPQGQMTEEELMAKHFPNNKITIS